MTIIIADEVTRVWPTTEKTLSDDETVNYATQKILAIERAKHDLYGSATVPAEASIPASAAYWIADKAALYLIPLAKDFYMSKQRLSDSKEGATISYYDKIRALGELKTELESACLLNKDDALGDISATTADPDDTPAVSTEGMMVDAVTRATWMGIPPYPNPFL